VAYNEISERSLIQILDYMIVFIYENVDMFQNKLQCKSDGPIRTISGDNRCSICRWAN
jgi:hypothetical protein